MKPLKLRLKKDYFSGNKVPACPKRRCSGEMLDDSRIGGIKCRDCGLELTHGAYITEEETHETT
jgi:ribosomal protein L37AE/L43A